MSQETTTKRKTSAVKVLTGIVLVIIIAGLVSLGLLGQRYFLTQMTGVEQKFTATQQALAQQKQQLMQQAAWIKNLQEQWQQKQSNTQAEVARVLAEVDYLVKLTAFNLLMENNTVVARQLLKTADQRIAMLNDPKMLPVRQALGADLAALNAAPSFDLAGLIIQLNALSRQIEQLPRIPRLTTEPMPAPPRLTHQSSAWQDRLRQFISAVGQTLKSLLVIHYQVNKSPPLLPPDQYIFIITNIQSQLALAQWAALHQQPRVYQQSLNQALTWIQSYFSSDKPQVQSLLKNLHDLLGVAVKSPLPDLNRSIQAIQQAMQET